MIQKKIARKRRALKTRSRIKALEKARLCVFKTPRHIYAQIISASNDRVLASASTVEPELKKSLKATGNVEAAAKVGQLIAARAVKAKVTKVVFDRSGFRYHGRVKALAEAARAGKIEF